jgi:hypothetical protein
MNMNNVKLVNVLKETGAREFVAGFTGDAKAFRAAKKGIAAAFDDVLRFATTEQKLPVGLTAKSPNQVVPLTNLDDLLYALKTEGGMAADVLAKFNQGLLKSSKTPTNLIDGITIEVVGSKNFVKRYGKLTDSEMRKALKAAGYSDGAVESFMKNAKKNPDFKKSFQKGVESRKLKKTTSGKNKTLSPKGNNKKVSPKQKKTLLDRTKELINNINVKKMSWKQLLVWGVPISVGAVAIWWWLYEYSGTIPDDTPESEPTDTGVWLPCVQQMIDSKEGKIVTNYSNGQVSVFIKTTEFPGGLNYYQDGKVMNTATKEMGKYVCNKGGTTTISEVVGRVLRERLLHEQGSEIDIDTMTKYVDDAVDDLDGFVATYNLNNLINIITNLKGKKFQGKDALSEFLGLYKEDEGGDDFLSDVESVGVKTLGTKGILAKRQLLSILKGGGGNSQKTDTGGGNSGTTIIWDKDKKEDGGSTSTGGGGGKTGIYRDCENMDFPLPVGCRSTKIAEIQKCLGVVDDGKLGPKTMKAMEDNKYDTSRGLSKDVYDAILTNCGKKPDGLNLTSLAPTDLNPIIPPKVPVEPVFDENRLNQLLTNENLVKLRDGDVVKWKGPALEGNDYYILNQYLEKQGYVQKTQRETGNKDDEDVTMKYKWKLENSPK